ncbi:MAG: hypothetical protein QOH50_1929, partial [Kribbellaceae bacterium]|nr:hypothetical protein [Kribbellaceae bacterium]
RRIRGPHLQPQRSLTRSLPRRPTAALDPGDLDGPHSAHSAGSPSACPTRARRTRPNKQQDHHKQSLYGFRGLPVGLVWVGGEGDVLVVVLPGVRAVVQAAKESVEQVALGGGVAVAGGFASVVVGSAPGARRN